MRYRAALAAAALAVAGATMVLPGRATAAEAGFAVRITELPATFGAGAESRSLTVVISSDRDRCSKVRWSLLLRVDGPALDDVKVTRVEDDGEFAVRRDDSGTTARITDVALDPGRLCRDRTVTARYQIRFGAGAATGSVTFQPQAFTATGNLLQETSGRSPVVGQEPAAAGTPAPSPSPTETAAAPADEESNSAEDDGAATDQPVTPSPGDLDAVPAAAEGGPPSLLGPGLIVGALLVFLGIGLLLRLRSRQRTTAARLAEPPTGFYPLP
ncbi:hypothetical protein [Actinoplanes sp. N902-109]|uniref:hypothetical protein n=1 Tax=Actinoplanes sp. (strain N902-109) TaxID=649831 RepID=UPI000329662F|nr:hypothetical protein [Actinoplanes sp. N902-109]AGL18753.1 hypothetical protein L083_5243 [Actinoplanes sp. N902-109]